MYENIELYKTWTDFWFILIPTLKIDAFGSDAVKEKYLPRLAKGELIGCFVSPLLSTL